MDALIAAMNLQDKIAQISTYTPSTVPGVKRIGLPAYSYHSEGLHGLRDSMSTVSQPCTVFPQTTGMAATGNLSLISTMGEVMGMDSTFPLAFAKSQLAISGQGLPTAGTAFVLSQASSLEADRRGRSGISVAHLFNLEAR